MKTEELVREFVRTHKIAPWDTIRAKTQLDDKRVKGVTQKD